MCLCNLLYFLDFVIQCFRESCECLFISYFLVISLPSHLVISVFLVALVYIFCILDLCSRRRRFWITLWFLNSRLWPLSGLFTSLPATQKHLIHFKFFPLACIWILSLPRTFVCENHSRPAVSEILWETTLAPTIILQSKSLRSHFFPILTFILNNSWTSWPRLHAYIHLVVATLLAD